MTRIAIVEDNQGIRESLAAYVRMAPEMRCVCTCGTAEEALGLVLRSKYDAILVDLNLSGSGPNADGYNVAQRLKIASGSHKPELIYMSGEVIEEGQGSSASASYRRLQKPFRISDVLNTLMVIFSRVPTTTSKR